jgi:hypothetical protein
MRSKTRALAGKLGGGQQLLMSHSRKSLQVSAKIFPRAAVFQSRNQRADCCSAELACSCALGEWPNLDFPLSSRSQRVRASGASKKNSAGQRAAKNAPPAAADSRLPPPLRLLAWVTETRGHPRGGGRVQNAESPPLAL